MIQKLKTWWPTVAAFGAPILMAALPSLQHLVAAHPVASSVVGAIAWISGHLAKSPLASVKK